MCRWARHCRPQPLFQQVRRRIVVVAPQPACLESMTVCGKRHGNHVSVGACKCPSHWHLPMWCPSAPSGASISVRAAAACAASPGSAMPKATLQGCSLPASSGSAGTLQTRHRRLRSPAARVWSPHCCPVSPAGVARAGPAVYIPPCPAEQRRGCPPATGSAGACTWPSDAAHPGWRCRSSGRRAPAAGCIVQVA